MTGQARLATAAFAAMGLLMGSNMADATATAHGAPVVEAAPAHPPATTRANGSCTAPAHNGSADANAGLLWVRAHPSGMVAIWIPGLNAKHCVARRTVSGAGLAQRAAAAIRHAKAFPSEPLPCPYDDGTSVRLYFTYSHGGDEYAGVALAGCRPITAPGRASRWSDAALEKPLHRAAPADWRSYLAS